MCAHVLFNLHVFNKLKKRDQIQSLPSILLLFCNGFNKFSRIQEHELSNDTKTTEL